MPGTLTPTPQSDAESWLVVGDVPPPLHPTDQEKFDAEVARDGGIFLHVLGAAGILTAIGLSTVALVVANQNHTSAMAMPATPVAAAAAVPAVSAVSAARTISLSVTGGNKKGPDGKLHDSFSKTNFAVKVGRPTRLLIDNTDSSPHSIVAAGTGVNITVYPGTHTYEIVATKAGRFEWKCMIPCDTDAHGWAMNHPGYMAGYISAT
jgi:uncharacterized cupredoxin-like copper-binding protein